MSYIERKLRYDARQFYEEKLSKNPNMPSYNHMMAAITAANGENQKATGYFKNCIAANQYNTTARNDLALHYEKLGLHQEAVDEFKRTLLLVGDQPNLHKNLGAIHARHGNYKEANEHVKKVCIISLLLVICAGKELVWAFKNSRHFICSRMTL